MRIWIVAGEESGDYRASEVMQEVLNLNPDGEFMGAGGPRMAELATGPFDDWIEQAGVLGLWDVLKQYGYFRTKFHGMLRKIEEAQPAAVVFVDYPGFNLRLAKAIRQRKIATRILYYVSPQVWAWNRGRIPKMAQLLDLMLCIFPFEKELYEQSGLATEFVGHPMIERLAREPKFPREENLLGLFPGSREREIKRIFPPMLDSVRLLQRSHPGLRFEAAAASESHAIKLREMAGGLPVTIRPGVAHELMQRATAGIVCSGTATLESAVFGLPYCLIYRTAWLTFEVGKRLVKIDHLGIVNILGKRTVVREFIQGDATGEALAKEAARLLDSEETRAALQVELREVVGTLDGKGASRRAAEAILGGVGCS